MQADHGTQGASPNPVGGAGGAGARPRAVVARWALGLLAALFLLFRLADVAAPVVRVLAGWARANHALANFVGSLVAAAMLVVLAWDQAQPAFRGAWRAFRGVSSTRRRPATDGDRGRDRVGAPEATRIQSQVPPSSAPPPGASPNEETTSALLSAILELRDHQLAIRQDQVKAEDLQQAFT